MKPVLPEISVVAPCYNEAESLPELHRRLTAVCAPLGEAYEIVLVDDGSRDATWRVMSGLAATDPHLLVVKLSRNHGHQLALTAGLSVCRGNRVLIIDADLQDPPELLPRMLEIMDGDSADVVYGQRRDRAGESRFKLWTAAVFYRLIDRITDVSIPHDTGDFRLISRRALDVFMAMPERHRFIRGMIAWVGFRQVPLIYDRDARLHGATKYPIRKMIRFALDAVTAFSVKPLEIATIVGMISAVFALGLLAYSLISWFTGAVSGWTSLMAAIALLGSVQLVVLGIIGEYLGRLYEQSKGRPLFVIEQIARGGQAGDEESQAPADAAAAGAPPSSPPADADRD